MNRHARREAARQARRAKPAKTMHDKAMDRLHHLYAGRQLLEAVTDTPWHAVGGWRLAAGGASLAKTAWTR